MEKFSVKKPFTILVAVFTVLLLGVMSISSIQTDLLPDITTPYLVVITVYPGGSPEQVESEVSKVIESTLGSTSGVESITSTSAENYSLVQLEFSTDTDMAGALVQVSNSLDQISGDLPDICLTPSIMELSMNMMPMMTLAVNREGYDIYELSEFMEESVIPYLERQSGVSSVSSSGLVEQIVQVELNEDKIADVNDLLLAQVDAQLAIAKEQLDAAQAMVDEGRATYEAAKNSYGETLAGTAVDQMASMISEATAEIREEVTKLMDSINGLIAVVQEPEIQQALIDIQAGLQGILDKIEASGVQTIDDVIDLIVDVRSLTDRLTVALQSLQERLDAEGSSAEDLVNALEIQENLTIVYETMESVLEALNTLPEMLNDFETAYGQLNQSQLEAYLEFTSALNQLEDGEEQLAAAKEEYEAARESAYTNADVTNLLTIDILSTLIYAQNFSMPAGYIDDEDDNSWLLKVGEEYDSIEDLTGTLLLSVEGVGDIYLSDVADVEIVDDSANSYTRLNGEVSTILNIYKNSTASSNEVSNNCLEAIEELEERYEGLSLVVVSNQGDYITVLIKSILTSMAIGALLAIIVLAIFLQDIKPTLVVGLSIPLSVLCAVLLIYFTGLTLNMMTLAGLSLGIGMLVDNSVVVIENIYRLRGRGIPAARAAVQGARQVEGSIIASTLTSICVFLPVIYTGNFIREMMLPMSLVISYCLVASLIIALTVVPAASATLLKNAKPHHLAWFEKVQDAYGKSLEWVLNHKLLPLAVTIVLLVVCASQVFSTGIVMIPEITSTELTISMSTADGLTREQSYGVAGEIMEAALEIENVDEVAVSVDTSIYGVDVGMLNSSITSLLGTTTSGYGSYTYNVKLTDDIGNKAIDEAIEELEQMLTGFDVTATVEAGGINELTSMLGSGLTVNVYGSDLDTLEELSEQVIEIINSTEGFENATNGLGEGDQVIQLDIDKDEARACGLTVAEVYQEIAARLTTSTTSTSVTLNGSTMSVQVVDNLDPLTVENLMELSFDTTNYSADGSLLNETHTLSEFASVSYATAPNSIARKDQTRYISITADTVNGYNTTVQSRKLETQLDEMQAAGDFPDGYTISLGGETDSVNIMVTQMTRWLALALPLVYFVMVAQFQSLLSPFIVLFTIPLAFTGGMLGMMALGTQLSMISLMGFIVLMGTVVNNGILFVDYTNQLRKGGMERRAALIATGKTRMRPILMTALTTILAMTQLLTSDDMASQVMSGMAVVVIGGLLYATFTTLYIVPIMYDILFKKQPHEVDVGSDDMDDIPDDAAEFLAAARIAQGTEGGSDVADTSADASAAAGTPAEATDAAAAPADNADTTPETVEIVTDTAE